MRDISRFYLVKEKDDPQFTYLHPSVDFLSAGTEVVDEQLAGRRVIIVKDVTYESLVEVIKQLHPRQAAAETGTIYPTQELVDIVTNEAKKRPA